MLKILRFKNRAQQSTQTPLLDSDKIPQHVAIIMDGNGRWATSRSMPRIVGHRKGVEVVKQTVKDACDLGIKHLTLFAFSTENWNRPLDEISGLMGLLKQTLKGGLAEFHENGVRLKVLGRRERLEPQIVELIDHAVQMTAENTRFNLNIAFNYGGRDEIVHGAKEIARQVKEGTLSIDDIDENLFAQQLFTCGIPDPELFIRTSNENRISNYMLWQMAYTEMVFVETHWPDFTKNDLLAAVIEYQKRDRRFGKASSK